MNTSLIAFFGSSDRLLRTVEDIARETGRSIKFYKYALDDAVDPAIRAVEEDCVDVIIAYRGTANLIKKSVNVPVLSVQNFELYKIDAISKLCKYSRNIIIPTTDCEEVNTEQLSRLFGANIHTIRYSNSKDLETSIREYKRRYSDGTVVSGGLACHFAHLYGLRHYLIVPAKRHIREVIDDAFSVAAANRENELWVRSCEAILNNVSDGVIAVDKDGFITLCNRQSYELLDLHEKIIGQQLRNVLPELGTILDASAPRNYSILQIGRTKFVIKFVPIELRTGTRGSLFTFNTARRVITGGKLVSRAVSQANRAKYSVEDYIHRSTVIDKMLMQLRLYASSNSTVLITGESGTGKEILAHALHNCSARRGRPFVSINCAAIPEQLLESELFGYEGGSFTGSLKEGKTGIFENADEGTLFIDEVNSLPLNVQLLLLRALQEKEIRRVGSDKVIPLNIRVVAATNKSLIDEVLRGRMREDLFFRLNVLVLEVPPLRKHAEDIPDLARHFARKVAAGGRKLLLDIPDEYLEELKKLPWPGNTRELEHFIERLVLLCSGTFSADVFRTLYNSTLSYQKELAADAGPDPRSIPQTVSAAASAPLPEQPEARPQVRTPSADKPSAGSDSPAPADGSGPDRQSVLSALEQCRGRKGEAAKLLGISRVTLWRLIKKLRID